MRYLIRRLVRTLPIIIVGTFFTAWMPTLIPGDPITIILGTSSQDPAKRAELEERLGLDKPLPVRYLNWWGDVLSGDLGKSYTNDIPVWEQIRAKLPRSLFLMVYAQFIALAVAIPMGVLAAYRPNGIFDRITSFLSFAFIAVPPFIGGLVLVFVLALKFRVFKATGYIPLTEDPIGHFKSMFLPALTLAVGLIAPYSRLLRTDMIATLQQDFILMARSKGLGPGHVLFRHALRPSMFSLITSAGVNIGTLIGGAVIVEGIFALGGLGDYVVRSALARNYLDVQGAFLFIVLIFVAANLLVEVLYGVLDPRVRHARAVS